jgi:hypothetical protein
MPDPKENPAEKKARADVAALLKKELATAKANTAKLKGAIKDLKDLKADKDLD